MLHYLTHILMSQLAGISFILTKYILLLFKLYCNVDNIPPVYVKSQKKSNSKKRFPNILKLNLLNFNKSSKNSNFIFDRTAII